MTFIISLVINIKNLKVMKFELKKPIVPYEAIKKFALILVTIDLNYIISDCVIRKLVVANWI